MANNESSQGVSTCYVFKSRLQEYAQKAGLPTPVYETIKEGPSHEPIFRSTVIVDNVRYDSLPGFFNRKAAEQSAAEVALMKLLDSGTITSRLSQPVHETGLCKNLLQEYAQKMNFAMPQYESQKSETSYSCTIEIGGMKYIGGEAKTKKEAEIKAARTALLAIQSSGLGPNNKPNDYPVYTVIPQKKVTDLGISNQESAAALKPKKARFKKKKKRNGSDASNQVFTLSDLEVKMVNQAEPEFHENAAVSTQGTESGPAHLAATMDVLVPCSYGDSNEHKTSLMVNQNDYGTLNLGINSQCGGGDMTEVSAATGGMQVTSEVDSSAMFQGELHGGTSCLKQVTSEVDSSALFQGELHVGTSCLKQVTSEIDSSAMFQGELHGVTSCLKQVTSEVESSAMFQGELDGGTRCLEQVTSEVDSSAMFQGELHGGTSCLEQVTSEVDSSAMFQGEQHAGTSCLELQTPRATDADQGRSTNVEAEIS